MPERLRQLCFDNQFHPLPHSMSARLDLPAYPYPFAPASRLHTYANAFIFQDQKRLVA